MHSPNSSHFIDPIDLIDKRKNRKQYLSAIERRRREKINHCLDRLRSIVPTCVNDSTGNLQRLTVLEKTIDHILDLHQKILVVPRTTHVPASPASSHDDSLTAAKSRSLMDISNLID
ncbi:hypothetical protein BC833DRAFT_604838 [Globomyces pollinis-pini]|nr:hypothetical protein BC833DRAFT_604838 [Globomyces pollinis-pini]